MKQYTIYDNADGGYSVWYKYYDYSIKQYLKRSYYAYDKKAMIKFTNDLKNNGYVFVGKI